MTQALLSGGDTATAFKWVMSGPMSARLFVSIANDAPKATSGATAANRWTSDRHRLQRDYRRSS